MVKSLLNSDVNYPEIKTLDAEDKSYDADLYELNILGSNIIIALGNTKYTFIDDNIIYYPIYLVENDKVTSQIGVYEVLSNRLPDILDEDGDVDINELTGPLLYAFIEENPNLLKMDKISIKVSSDSEEDDSEEDDSEEDDSEEDNSEGRESPDIELMNFEPLKLQTKDMADDEKETFKKIEDENWVQSFLRNNNFNIIDNEMGGDCLFACIRDGFARIGKKITVKELREKLSQEATEEIFQNYKSHYDMYIISYNESMSELKDLKKLNAELKKRLAKTSDRNSQSKIVEEAKKNKDRFEKLTKEKNLTNELLEEFRFMEDVDTLQDFKDIIQTCEFWGETWAISTLERILNIKLILFSEESYNEKDTNNVLQCGQLNDARLEEQGVFNPDFYLMLDYNGWHYKLITYKSRGAFSFLELPYDIKKLIVNKCMERQAGPYAIIPDFIVFASDIGMDVKEDAESLIMRSPELYNEDTVFKIHSKAADHPLPGKGTGEKMGKEGITEYVELASMENWRRKLSNKWSVPFKLDGKMWNSVEHYYQGAKFKENHPDFYSEFALDSGSELSKDVELAKSMGSTNGKHKGKRLRPKEIEVDATFFDGKHKKIMEEALYEKFTQDDEMKLLLLNTKNSKLIEFVRGSPPKIMMELMNVRKKIKAK